MPDMADMADMAVGGGERTEALSGAGMLFVVCNPGRVDVVGDAELAEADGGGNDRSEFVD